MATVSEWNTGIVEEFRDSGGLVGGQFEGAPLLLLHHFGRTTGEEYIAPMMYLPNDDDVDLVYVFASKNGAPSNPDWYYNLTSSGTGAIEIGTEHYSVSVTELTGDERDAIYTEQATRYPGFAEYAEKTAGIRTIPVLALRRA
jgi:deazaflavin-dependent oxidoreductase (nitroreductase family)